MRIAALVAAALLPLTPGSGHPPGLVPDDCGCWRYVGVPRNTGDGVLTTVTAPSFTTAWAAGSRGNAPLLLRWNGVRWTAEPLPIPADTLLTGVSAASGDDVWTIGYRLDGTPRTAHRVAGHWRPVTLPGSVPAFPRALDTRTTSDAWIVGSAGPGTVQATAWHWDGWSWQRIDIPDDTRTASNLTAVSAHAEDDIWAIGTRGANPPHPLILHGDGESWTPRPGPVLPGETILTGVVANGPDDVWTVGTTRTPGTPDLPLAEHWTGGEWQVVPVPGADGRFTSVTADGQGGIWAAGSRADGTPLFAHWTGAGWRVSPAPIPPIRVRATAATAHGPLRPAAGTGQVWALTRIRATDSMWAVGSLEIPVRNDVRHAGLTWSNSPRPR